MSAPREVRIFVHGPLTPDATAETTVLIPGIRAYAERAFLLAGPQDVVCLLDAADEAYLDYLAGLGIGSGRGRIVVARSGPAHDWGVLPEALLEDPAALHRIHGLVDGAPRIVLDPFMATPGVFELARVLAALLGRDVAVPGGTPRLVAEANEKHRGRALARALGVPVVDGEVVALAVGGDGRPLDLAPLERAIERRRQATGRVILRGTHGRSGTATFVTGGDDGSVAAALRWAGARRDNRIYLVEPFLEVTVSPNIQMSIDAAGGRIACAGVTDQRWAGDLVHGGNVYPSRARTLSAMIGYAAKLAAWLQRRGYTGLAGFDFGETADPRTGEPVSFLAEINARTNAAAYPIALMERLNRKLLRAGRPRIGAFVTAYVETAAGGFAELRQRCGDLLFDPGTGAGAVPYNVGGLRHGKVGLVVFGRNRDEALGALHLLTSRLAGAPAVAAAAAPGR